MLNIELIYAAPQQQWLVAIALPNGSVVSDAIDHAKKAALLPGEAFTFEAVGIFGRVVSQDKPLKQGDRLELYRPLTIDPKEKRRLLAKSRAAN